MTLELGDVIARIGGDGGGGPAPLRYVYDLGGQTIPVGESLLREVDADTGDTVVATLEWDGAETGGLGVALMGSFTGVGGYQAAAAGVAMRAEDGALVPVSIVGEVDPQGIAGVQIMSLADGWTATRLTVIVIPTINEAT